jgi:spermidine synthase
MRANFFIVTIIAGILGFSVFFWQSEKSELFYHTENEFGPVWVYDEEGLRCVTFLEPPSPIIQSCMSLSNPKNVLFEYAQIFLSTLFIKEDPREILIIGLGGATLPKALNILVPNANIHIVEINPAIPPIAEKYFGYKFNKTNQLFVEDGVEYVKNSPAGRYDIVFIDAFSADYIPKGVLTSEFMQNVKRVMKENGVVAMNTFIDSAESEIESKLFNDVFGEYYNLKNSSTRVMLASSKKLPNYNKIALNSNIWLYRMAEVGVNQAALVPLFKNSLSH